jgi:hypothetical protein
MPNFTYNMIEVETVVKNLLNASGITVIVGKHY